MIIQNGSRSSDRVAVLLFIKSRQLVETLGIGSR